MRLRIKILLAVIILFTALYISAYLFLFFQGRSILTKQLAALTHKEVSIGHFGLIPPLNLQINNLVIEGLAKVEAVSASPSILGLLTGNIALNSIKLVKPEITYQKMPAPEVKSGVPKTTSDKAGEAKKPPLRLICKHISIKSGKVNFIDQTVSPAGIKIILKDLNFNLSNLYLFPRSVITNFELKSKISWQEGEGEGRIEAEGWLNLFKKDMQATLKIEDIDGIYLYPYYSNWVDLEKARIEKAKLNFTSDIQGLNNDITAQCHLELTDIVRRPLQEGEGQEKAARITDAVLGIFRALNKGKMSLNFTIRTKMDNPQFGFANIKTAFEDKLTEGRKVNGFNVQNVLALPGNIIQSTLKSATDLTRAVIDGTVSVGKELKKAVEDSFKKEKNE